MKGTVMENKPIVVNNTEERVGEHRCWTERRFKETDFFLNGWAQEQEAAGGHW